MAPSRRVGAYAKLLANYAEDDAIIAAGEKAELLFVRGLAFCADSDSDGFITDAQLLRVVGAGMRDAIARARKLTHVGLWVREEGGYLVRTWTKIHETTQERGRRLKTDRERKAAARQPTLFPDGQRADSERTADRNPPDSLSMTVQDRAVQDRAPQDGTTPGEHRHETLPPADATQPPPDELGSPAEARCTRHTGIADPPPCNGCRAARERAEHHADRAADQAQRDHDNAIRNCPDCHGTNWRENPDGTPVEPPTRCAHPRTRRSA